MQRFEYETETLISTHSFDWYQVSVVTISTRQGKQLRGIAIFPIPATYFDESAYIDAHQKWGKPLVLNSRQSIHLCQYIENILEGRLPGKYEIFSNGLNLKIVIKKYIKKWHGGGGYKGSMGFKRFIYFGLTRVTISKKTLIEFRNSLMHLYQLDEFDSP